MGKKRIKAARRGWLATHSGPPILTPSANTEPCSGNLRFLFPPNLPVDSCRGGKGGAAATARKRDEMTALVSAEADLLKALVGVLDKFKQPTGKIGKGKGKGKTLRLPALPLSLPQMKATNTLGFSKPLSDWLSVPNEILKGC